ncbi:MAG TPA: ATP-binding protein [Alphaproteobacteria bacterium]|jgi:two-component system cell cycle sensor histidine kinase PleC
MTEINGPIRNGWRVERLITPLPPIPLKMTCGQAFDLLSTHSSTPSLAVVDDASQPIALLSRQDFYIAFSQPLVRAVYEKRSVARFMASHFINSPPLQVDWQLSIEELKELITTMAPRAAIDGFIITRDGKYAGIGNGVDLLGISLERAREQISDLEEARAAALRANQAKSTFLASISHELRTPLNAIIGFSELLQKQYAGTLNPKQGEYVSDVLRSGTHLLELINDILDLSKAEAGKLDINESEVDINGIARLSLRMLGPRAADKRITLDSHLPHRPLRILGDRQRLKQVLLNLLSNAVKFTPADGHVRISAIVAKDGAPTLIVEDDGIGIAAQDIDKIMLPFERAQTQMGLAVEGTGIGLPLSKSFVESHGGTLTLTSEPGKGTTVTVRLPPDRLRFHGAVMPAVPADADAFATAS